ncbi:FAD binding domain-containing protein [Variovorax sp. RA8]|uniref:FAD binding domain-containing protein n=1 Tax=Variovorax sp. (strain JCM 16519 / RA8) TaxID=662548 RepID=UPI0013166C06|nr:FAD binding domain-containing protein [Variovorax sp. RA8]VTU29416.1 Caffeine dehydrogenase subunit beta [Variovorax sp. RA8]
MKPAAFDYVRAETADEAVQQLRSLGTDARILAGGQSLMAVLNMRLAQPSALIDISRTADLTYVRAERGMLAVGAAATQGSVEWRKTLAQEVPLLAQAFPLISHFQIRNRGTVCGSVAHADPSAEIPLVLLALGGEVVLRNASKRRTLPAPDFFQGMLMTARAPDELLEEVRFPLAAAGQRSAFTEFSARHGDFAIVSVAAVADASGVRLAVGGVADRPRLAQWPAALRGAELEGVLNDFAWELEAQEDAHASATFRRHLVRRLGAQVLRQVMENPA